MNQQLKPEDMIALVNHYPCKPVSEVDPRRAQLLALFEKSDQRGQDLLLAIAAIHAQRYPKEAQ